MLWGRYDDLVKHENFLNIFLINYVSHQLLAPYTTLKTRENDATLYNQKCAGWGPYDDLSKAHNKLISCFKKYVPQPARSLRTLKTRANDATAEVRPNQRACMTIHIMGYR